MTGMTDDAGMLAARGAELEVENARLREAGASPPAAEGARSPSRWRSAVSVLCLVIATVLVPVAIVTAWARIQLVDEDSFVETLAPLADDPAVQDLVVAEAMSAIRDRADFETVTSDALQAIVDLGAGPRASAALRLLEGPIASGLDALVENSLQTVVESDGFSDVWATAVRASHRALTTASTSDGAGLVVLDADGVGIRLGPIVDELAQRLTDRGIRVAELIPTIDAVVIVGSGETLMLLRSTYGLATAVGWWLPVLALALLVAGVLAARRRSAGVVGAGVALMIGAAALGIGLTVAGTAVASVASSVDLSPSALDVIYRQVVGDMVQTAWVTTVLGILVVCAGWLMGRSAAAAGVRAAGAEATEP